ncbi:ABC transporter ATP-binding protein [Thiopseudomonas alkaliphila]|uniref:ABC transporter ATP-binding protein n=1 Tax=Thiopseudomonas alkaliphila TaxID=1697053 RepID=UPI0035716FEA
MLDLSLHKTMRSGKRQFQLALDYQSHRNRLVIFGPSGSGKSLTLRMIAGLLQPDHGYIRVNQRTLFSSAEAINLTPQQRQMAFLFQDYALFPHLTVRQNIGFGLRSGWLNPRRHIADPAIDYWLNSFALVDLQHQLPSELSGGQRQRTALARALVAQPKALLLDEPFAALDPGLRVHMRQELDELQQRLQVPMILITHDEADVKVFGQEVLYLKEGAIDQPLMLNNSPKPTSL